MSELSRHAGPPQPTDRDEVSVLELISVLLRRWQILAVTVVLSGGLALGYSLLTPPTFTASTTFVPEAQSQRGLPAGLSGLAATLGVSIGTEASQSPRFYAEIFKSREILTRTLQTRYANQPAAAAPEDSITLLEVLAPGGKSHAESLNRALKVLGRLISISIDNQTNIVRVSVDSHDPDLAAAVANRLVDYVNEFNAKTRQSKARMRRLFVEGRIADSEGELRGAEDQLKTFYQRNRTWDQSPELRVEEGRLRRQVEIRQEVLLTLRREYEMARIEEVNDSPVITVIDPAVPPLEKSKPRRAFLMALGLCIGGALGLLGALCVEYLDRLRGNQAPEYRELSELTLRLRRDVRELVGGLGRKSR